jgi:mannuronan 5-epimerase
MVTSDRTGDRSGDWPRWPWAFPRPNRWRPVVVAVAGGAAGLLVAGLLVGGLVVARLGEPPAPHGAVVATETPPVTRYPVPSISLVVAPTGDDRAPGTIARPLRTVAHAVRRASSGTTVVLRAGTYREGLGKLRKRLTLQPYPGERVWLKGSEVVTDWRRDGLGWRHDGWSPQLCRSCFLPAIISSSAPLAGHPDMVFVNGVSLPQVAVKSDLRPGNFWVDTASHVLWLGSDPTGRSVEATTIDRLIQLDPGAEGSVLRGLGVAQYGSNQEYGRRGAMVVVNAQGVTLQDNAFVHAASTGAAVFQPDANVDGNVFAHNGLAGLVGNRADRIRLVGNTAVDNNVERFALTGAAVGAAGVKLAHTRSPYIADNVFRDNHGSGWWCDLGCSDAVVVRNVARGNVVNGIYYEVSSRALIASNVMHDNARHGLKVSSSDHVRIWSNTFIGNRVALGIYNDPRDVSADAYSAAQGQPWLSVHLELVDNFFASSDRSKQPYLVTADYKKPSRTTAGQMLARADGNVYLRGRHGEPPFLVSWWHGPNRLTRYATVAVLTRHTGREQSGVEAVGSPEDVFVDLSREDYRLRPDAPGVRAGQPLPRDIAEAIGVLTNEQPDVGALAGPRR